MKRFVLGVFLLAGAVDWGQTPSDPPTRVGRLSFVEGSVSYRPAAVQDWAAATLNYPLISGDRLWTTENSYAEIHIGAMAIHLAPQTDFTLTSLDDTVAQMSVARGTVYIWIPVLDAGQTVEVDTPHGNPILSAAGAYRVDVDPQNNATSIKIGR